MNTTVTKARKLTESAMLLAVAIVLELIAKMVIPEMPFGGQVTLVSSFGDGAGRKDRVRSLPARLFR